MNVARAIILVPQAPTTQGHAMEASHIFEQSIMDEVNRENAGLPRVERYALYLNKRRGKKELRDLDIGEGDTIKAFKSGVRKHCPHIDIWENCTMVTLGYDDILSSGLPLNSPNLAHERSLFEFHYVKLLFTGEDKADLEGLAVMLNNLEQGKVRCARFVDSTKHSVGTRGLFAISFFVLFE